MDAITPNDRLSIGGNNPPEDLRDTLEARARELRAAGSAWVNEIQDITSKDQADLAAAFKRQCGDLVKQADKNEATEKKPHNNARKEIKEFWDGVRGHVATPLEVVGAKLTKWLEAEDARQKAELAAAAKAAEDARSKAAEEAEKAYETYDKANRGELAGTGVNTMAALEKAEKFEKVAIAAEERAEALAERKIGAGGQYAVGGIKRTVSLRTRTRLALDLPERCPDKIKAAALQKLIPFILDYPEQFEDLMGEMGRIVNVIYRATNAVPAVCKVVEERKVV